MEENVIKDLLESNIKYMNKLYELLATLELLNEQYVLDWLDKLNEISVR